MLGAGSVSPATQLPTDLKPLYFGLGALSWFLQPFLLMVVTALVVLVVYRREFRSHTLTSIGRPGEGIPAA
jgi:uncharacterized membrane protein